MTADVAAAAALLTDTCHGAARVSGWWNSGPDGALETCRINKGDRPAHRIVQEKLALIHSEVSEALEGHRKGKQDDHLPHRLSLEVELADAVIRLFDLAGGMGLDIAGALVEKLAYNAQREDHKREARLASGGKSY